MLLILLPLIEPRQLNKVDLHVSRCFYQYSGVMPHR